MFKYMKINSFPESLFYMDRMVGYEQEPKLLVEVERDAGQENSVRATFRTVVKEVSPCDHSKTVRKRVSVSLVSILDSKSDELSSRCYSNQSESYSRLSFSLKSEIESFLNLQLDEVIKVLKDDKLERWLRNVEIQEVSIRA